jgi:MFS family permease
MTMAMAAGDGQSDSGVRPWRGRALVPVLVLAAALVSLVSSLGAPLIPTIARADRVSLSTGQWLLTAALLTGALATPIMGRLADGPRQREVLLLALASAVVGCLLAAVSDNFTVVVVGRGLQGVGLGLLPVTMAIARTHLPAHEAVRAIATLSITAAIGVGLGYPLTSFVAQLFGFHAAFWFGAISVAGGLVLALVVVPAGPAMAARRFDLIGMAVLSLVVVGISVVLSEGGQWGWSSRLSLGILVTSGVLLTGWIPYELRCADPLVDLRQVRNRSVLTADISGFLLCVALYLFLPVSVEFVQIPKSTGYGFGVSIAVSGLVLVPLSVATFVASRFRAGFERRFGTRSMIPLGSTIFAISAAFFAFEHRALWEAFVAVGCAGLGYGFSFAAMPGFIVRAVPANATGSATGFYQVLRSIGLSVGSALGASLLSAYTAKGRTYPTLGGFQTTLVTGSALCLFAAVVSYVLPGRRGGAT